MSKSKARLILANHGNGDRQRIFASIALTCSKIGLGSVNLTGVERPQGDRIVINIRLDITILCKSESALV